MGLKGPNPEHGTSEQGKDYDHTDYLHVCCWYFTINPIHKIWNDFKQFHKNISILSTM